MPDKIWEQIVYQFPNVGGATIEVLEWKVLSLHTLYCPQLLISAGISIRIMLTNGTHDGLINVYTRPLNIGFWLEKGILQ